MELPLGGPALRHYTQSRPRPHRQKLNYRPSRPQETIIESENEVLELIGRVDEGVEEFFTKKVLPADTQKKQDEESITEHELAPASSAPCPPPTKTLRRKLGDFFTLRKRRGLKSETSHEGRPKKASIADLIRPLREVARAEKEKDKDRVKEQDKENEKEKGIEPPSAVTGESVVQDTAVSGALALRGEAVPPRRALREGKSQSLILLSGSAAAGTTNTRKKQFEGQHSFEQKLHLMLQRIGVSKAQPGETQNPEREMKKAESEGTIIDSKAEPPPTFTKPRTMSASSDTRHQIRPSASSHESAGKPALLPKPVIKPGSGPTTSGRNTPENELAQIQEGETVTVTKPSPTAALSAPGSPALSANTTPTVPTNSVPDSTNFTTSPSSTVTPAKSDICTDAVKPTAAATTTTNVTEVDSKASAPERSSTTTDLLTSTYSTTLISNTAPAEPPSPVPVTSTTSQSSTLSLSGTSSSTTITKPTTTTLETVSAPSSDSSVSTASPNLLAKSNDIIPVDAPCTAGGDKAKSVIVTASSVSTRISDIPSGFSTTTNLASVASDDFTSGSAASTSSVTSVALVTKTTSLPHDSSDTITTPVSSDAPGSTSSTLDSATLPPTNSTSSTSPTSTDRVDINSTLSITTPASPLPTDISVPSTTSRETNSTDSTTIASAAAISSVLTTDSENASTTLTSFSSSFPATDNTSATSHHGTTSSAPPHDSPDQDNNLQTCPEARSSPKTTAQGLAYEELKLIQNSGQAEKNEGKTVVDGGRTNCKDKPAPVDSNVTRKEMQEESVKPEEATVATVGTVEPASGKEGVLNSKEEVKECKNVEETKSVDEK